MKADEAAPKQTETVISISKASPNDPEEVPEICNVAEKQLLSTVSFKCDQCSF